MSAADTQNARIARADSPRSGIRLSFPSIDHCLGPGERRFFGSGYRESRYSVRGATFEPTTRGHVLRARAGVRHLGGFRAKAAGDRRPHLTTLDCLLLTVRAAETCVARQHGLDQRGRSRSWTRRFDVRAGATPIEDGLTDLPLEAGVEHLTLPPRAGAPAVSRVVCRLANMRVRVEVVHELDPRTSGPDRTPVFGPVDDDLLDGRHPGAFGHGFQLHRQSIDDLTVDLSTLSAAASVVLTEVAPRRSAAVLSIPAQSVPAQSVPALAVPAPREPDRSELAVRDAPARVHPTSMLDGFLVALQLGQALLYEYDGIARTDSDDLWMRSATITGARPARPGRARGTGPAGPLSTTAQLLEPKVVPLRGEDWRTAVVTGSLGGVHTRCAVAHQLPATAP